MTRMIPFRAVFIEKYGSPIMKKGADSGVTKAFDGIHWEDLRTIDSDKDETLSVFRTCGWEKPCGESIFQPWRDATCCSGN